MLLISFEPRHRRYLATHFPSKLVDYVNRGRPILIWDPPWCSAIRWGYFQRYVLFLTNSSAEHLLDNLGQWLKWQLADTPTILGLQTTEIADQFNRAVALLLQPPIPHSNRP